MVVFYGEIERSITAGHGEKQVIKVITTPIFENSDDCKKYIYENDYYCYGSTVVRKVVIEKTYN